MFVGHIGAGLALKRAERQVNLGILFLAVMLLDLVLWVLVLEGVESVIIPPDFAVRRYVMFVFPYSHSLVASILWSAGAAVASKEVLKVTTRGAVVVAAAVFSHFILDALVHVRGLPILGDDSYRVSFGLWNRMPLELSLEVAIAVGGFCLYASVARVSRARLWSIAGLTVLLCAITVAGQTFAAAPPSAIPAIIIIFVIAATGFWLDRQQDSTSETGHAA